MSKRSRAMKQRSDRPKPPVDAEGPGADEVAGAEEATAEVLPVEVGDAAVEEPGGAEMEHPAVAELAELTDRYLRLAADYDNFRKRTARERSELEGRAQADLARQLLEALDDLGRVAHLDPATAAASDVIAGVEMVERKMLRELGSAGLERVAATDVPFDPTYHEAIATVAAASEAEDHTVAAVFQVGYRFNGMLLRPARVQVRIWAASAST